MKLYQHGSQLGQLVAGRFQRWLNSPFSTTLILFNDKMGQNVLSEGQVKDLCMIQKLYSTFAEVIHHHTISVILTFMGLILP